MYGLVGKVIEKQLCKTFFLFFFFHPPFASPIGAKTLTSTNLYVKVFELKDIETNKIVHPLTKISLIYQPWMCIIARKHLSP